MRTGTRTGRLEGGTEGQRNRETEKRSDEGTEGGGTEGRKVEGTKDEARSRGMGRQSTSLKRLFWILWAFAKFPTNVGL
jgi:hypothetical protein